LEGAPTPKTETKTRRLTHFSPFNFKTDERLNARPTSSERDESSVMNSHTFKAREMP